MSRAFVKESDADAPDDGLPDKPESAHPNYVTRHGLAQLEHRLEEALAEQRRLSAAGGELAAKAPLARLARDVRYLRRRIDDAILVDANDSGDEVSIGATVTIDDGTRQTSYAIVGEDEADPLQGSISWTSPLASALMGAKRGAKRTWRRPVGDITVTVVEIRR